MKKMLCYLISGSLCLVVCTAHASQCSTGKRHSSFTQKQLEKESLLKKRRDSPAARYYEQSRERRMFAQEDRASRDTLRQSLRKKRTSKVAERR